MEEPSAEQFEGIRGWRWRALLIQEKNNVGGRNGPEVLKKLEQKCFRAGQSRCGVGLKERCKIIASQGKILREC